MRIPGVMSLWLLLAGCGYVGEPQFPALNIPNRVNNLGAFERGNQIDVSFTVPGLTTEGLVVKSISAVDLRVGLRGSGAFKVETWAERATQVDVKPPTIIIFCNQPDLLHFSYLRYLENTIRARYPFRGVPLKIELRKSGDDERNGEKRVERKRAAERAAAEAATGE